MTDYATIASTQQRAGESEIAWANRTYRPTMPGLHVCGGDHDANRVFTVLDIPARDDAEARAMWEAARAECAVEKDASDLVVDLNIDEGHVDDFYTSRQMLPRIEAAALTVRQSRRG
jgi:hypothetical protein